MKLLINSTNYEETINYALNLNDNNYDKFVIYHCFWDGILNEKHLYSILSCYYFNVYNNNNKKYFYGSKIIYQMIIIKKLKNTLK